MRPFEFGHAFKLASQTASGLSLRDHAAGCGAPSDTDADPLDLIRKPAKVQAKPLLVNSVMKKKASIGPTPLSKKPAGPISPGSGPVSPGVGAGSGIKPAAKPAMRPMAPPAPSLSASTGGSPAARPAAPLTPPRAAAPTAPIPPGGDSMRMMDRVHTQQAAGNPLDLMKIQRQRPLLVDRENINMAAGNQQGVGLPGGGYVARPAEADPAIRQQARQEMASYNSSGGPFGSLGGSSDRLGKMRSLASQRAPAASGRNEAFASLPEEQKWLQVRKQMADQQAQIAQTRAQRQQQQQVQNQGPAPASPNPAATSAAPAAGTAGAGIAAASRIAPGASAGSAGGSIAGAGAGAGGHVASAARPTAPAASQTPMLEALHRVRSSSRRPTATLPVGAMPDLNPLFQQLQSRLGDAGQAGAHGDRNAIGSILQAAGIGGQPQGRGLQGLSLENLPQLLKMFGLDRLIGNAA